ncbi:uroporphyrinogen-III C-methyltransferase [Photobacterium carnosum]|uniref:uroporphyrinogen-III C-methyltransferase n=1 Tax=Photobacterium carnosum TaxID=2023717 RepID=UPI00128C5D3E|nr:uroporphyrinogen-III C-methyltransferase [Photobacterium carnosum]KAE8176329.1 uroporphyrinogen-III C-methyltransferase [Photobacterium carnosum]MBY3789315.1 uroporphyrinogen-III C-methyltransferase [Photobacterium carnosum]MCD9515662.1 uroporphyrinogen-III C-methyltransferase [Photobacterium carnosum]MCD9527435.1 uroporphyrinogen-III C-methyltransferase [Photobacterium carnosum]MCD9534373.1 uroporphyrinogen-III C-methyltransferase [Photobacterium carnosum]
MTDKTTNTNSTAAPSSKEKPAVSASKNSTSNTTKTAPAAKQKKAGSKTGWVAIALVLALGGGLYYHGHQQGLQQQQQVAALQQQIVTMKAAMQADQQQTISMMNDELSTAQQKVEQGISQQQKSIDSIQTAIADLKGQEPNDWLLAEADYLVKMAGRKLWLEHDVTSATLLLEAADHRIAELNDPSLKGLRQAMSNDITALKSVTVVDRDGIVLRLNSLENSIDSLPLANAILAKAEPQQNPTVSQSVNDWKNNLMTSLKNFGENFITYRKRDGSVVPLLSPQQDFYLQQNITNKLETAIAAVYRDQGQVYRDSIATAIKWSQQYYDLSSPKTQSFIAGLQQLEQQNVAVDYPAKLQSQALITQLVNQVLRNKMTTLSEPVAVKATQPAPKNAEPAVKKVVKKHIKQATIAENTPADNKAVVTYTTKEETK